MRACLRAPGLHEPARGLAKCFGTSGYERNVEEGGGLAPDGHAETVQLDLSSWTEAGGATVTHVEDFANGTLYSNVTVDGTLYNFVGTIEEAWP
ncbi:hypothetical protein ABZ912_37760 [Nonomuraea angiospora]|uniref:MoaF-related domain-containing protein n=1 Tax=Nonomuraea angiospora TaxID=46172 RepID=UPI0033C2F502